MIEKMSCHWLIKLRDGNAKVKVLARGHQQFLAGRDFVGPKRKKSCRIPPVGGDMLLKMTADDLDLLKQFADNNSQDAFTTLVHCHLDLVYSAALRQVRSPQLAEEVSQSVFADLARNAGKLKSDTILTAWLYQVTRRTAIDVVRRESRRQLREQIASEMNAMNATASDWTHVEPFLDEAMHTLDETDRAAVLLRYFENKSFREVSQSLGTSEDAAQKRVSRAVEKLREFFSKRNVTIGASGLVVVISANAVQAAPVGLAATVSAAAFAGTAVSTSTVIAATKAIAMTAFQKTLITLTIAVAGGMVIYACYLRGQNRLLRQQQASRAGQIEQLRQQYDDATNQLASLQQEREQLRREAQELYRLRAEVTRLRHQQNISPETAQSETNNLPDTEKISIHLKTRFVSLPTEDLPVLGVDWISGTPDGRTGLLTEQQVKVINEALRGASDVNFVSEPEVITLDGQEAKMSATRSVPVGSTNANVGTSLDVTPYFSTNSSTFVLKLNAELDQLTGDSSQPDVQNMQLTNQVTLSPGQTVVLEKEIPSGGWLPNSTNITAGPRSLLVFVTPQVVDSRNIPVNVHP
jgi:RNA polymerase sigma factor (sigma-70 family)